MGHPGLIFSRLIFLAFQTCFTSFNVQLGQKLYLAPPDRALIYGQDFAGQK